jgi:hypothetical protein
MQTTPASASFISRVNLPACANVKVQELPTTVAPLPLATLMLSHATGMDWVCFVCLGLMVYAEFDYGSASFSSKACFKLSSGPGLEMKLLWTCTVEDLDNLFWLAGFEGMQSTYAHGNLLEALHLNQ